MFTCTKFLDRIENIKKRALRFVLDDYESSYHDLLIQCEVSGIKTLALRLLAIYGIKYVNKLNPEYLNEMFTIKNCPYDFRDTSILEGPGRILQSTDLNPLETMKQKYGTCYQTTVNQLYP